MATTVTELLKLYDDGIFVRTPKHPDGTCFEFTSWVFSTLTMLPGRRVRVILVAVCCDHPAMCKVGGFSDHKASNFPCTRCEISHKDIQTAAGLKVDGK
jgi:hypothetical protein